MYYINWLHNTGKSDNDNEIKMILIVISTNLKVGECNILVFNNSLP